jgi:hypothetical protein
MEQMEQVVEQQPPLQWMEQTLTEEVHMQAL